MKHLLLSIAFIMVACANNQMVKVVKVVPSTCEKLRMVSVVADSEKAGIEALKQRAVSLGGDTLVEYKSDINSTVTHVGEEFMGTVYRCEHPNT